MVNHFPCSSKFLFSTQLELPVERPYKLLFLAALPKASQVCNILNVVLHFLPLGPILICEGVLSFVYVLSRQHFTVTQSQEIWSVDLVATNVSISYDMLIGTVNFKNRRL